MTRKKHDNNSDHELNDFLTKFENDDLDINDILNDTSFDTDFKELEAPVTHRRVRRSEQASPAKKKKEKPVKPVKTKKTKERKNVSSTIDEITSNDTTTTYVATNRKQPESFKEKILDKFYHLIGADDDDLLEGSGQRDKTPKGKMTKKAIIKKILIACLALFVVGVIYCVVIIAQAPSIDATDINSLLNVSSTLYDDKGNAVDNVFEDQKRTIIEYDDLPENLVNAFVCLEDKTFWSHHGFNFIRIIGAIKDAVTSGSISGTSTITQQLARNVFLSDRMTEHSLNRKIIEAYYTVIIESQLTKEEIITAYLNTIYLGYGCYGVETASENYFGCKVGKLSLAECAALAALPQAPDSYALIQACDTSQIEKGDVILKKDREVTYVLNDTSKDRRETCLALMLDQEKITQKEYDKAVKTPLKKMIRFGKGSNHIGKSSYFADYIIDQVINDLQEEKGYTYEAAYEAVYRKGLKIYTTMDSTAQAVVDKEFNNQNNFPGVTNVKTNAKGNVLDANGAEVLFHYDNYFDSKGNMTLKSNEYKWLDDGSLMIKYGKRFNIYETSSNGVTDYSLEFKKLYYRENYRFFTVSGGYVSIPAEYKTVDSDFNLIISADFFKDFPNVFDTSNGVKLLSGGYKLNSSVVQPQGAMVIRDVNNGQIKAMVGGREINGEKLYNRATAPRQPGSSIKPLGVYSAALQLSYELAESGKKMTFTDFHNCKQGAKLYGDYLTAASAIDDEPTTIEGRIWPYNSYSGFAGLMSMRKAIQNSVNVCAVKILQQVGVEYSAKNIQNFGITTLVTEGSTNDMNLAALALGGLSKGVSPLEMSNAYTAFVNGGKVYESTCYTRVETNDGEVLLKKEKPSSKQAIDPGVAFIMRDLMFGVVSGGTGTSAAISGVRVGGKTGTTTDQYDIWFDGFTPNYAGALWIGNDVNMELTSMSGYAAALWGRIMNQIPKAKIGSYSAAPSNVVSVAVDADTGYLPGPGSSTRTEYFTKGTQPTKKDSYHKSVSLCAESGYLATPWCSAVKKISGFRTPYGRSKVKGVKSTKYYCNCHNLDPEKYPISPKETLKNVTPDPNKPDDENNDDENNDDEKNQNKDKKKEEATE